MNHERRRNSGGLLVTRRRRCIHQLAEGAPKTARSRKSRATISGPPHWTRSMPSVPLMPSRLAWVPVTNYGKPGPARQNAA